MVANENEQLRRAPILTFTAAVMALMGLTLAAGGIWLIALGGSLYYLAAGLALMATAWLLFKRRAAALWIYGGLLLSTMLWAVGEVGLDFWSLAPRGDVLAPLGAWLLLPFITSHLAPASRAPRLALGGVLAVAVVVLGLSLTSDRPAIAGTVAQANAAAGQQATESPAAAEDWVAYGG